MDTGTAASVAEAIKHASNDPKCSEWAGVHRRRNRGEGALAPPILGNMYIKYTEFILDTLFGPPPQSCLASGVCLSQWKAMAIGVRKLGELYPFLQIAFFI